jgi:hypothetical protein
VAEDVAVVDSRAAAESSHRLAKLLLDERVDDHRRSPLRPLDGEPQVVHGLHPRVDDVLELLVGELRLERLHEPLSRRAGGVGDHVEFDRRHWTGG